jgi:hypothetical protein
METEMPRPYYSTIFEDSCDQIWSFIRDFGNYGWAGVVSESHIEDGKSGDAVGCVRNVNLGDRTIRQRLLAHSDRERFYTYTFCEPIPFPWRNFVATLKVTPVIDSNRAFVEWTAEFDCTDNEHDRWREHLTASFGKWLEALRANLPT